MKQEKQQRPPNLDIEKGNCSKNPHSHQDSRRIFYADKFRIFVVKMNPENRRHSVLVGPNVDENRNKDENHIRNSVGSNVMNGKTDIDAEMRDSFETRMWMLGQFRRVYDAKKPSVRGDMAAFNEMSRKFKCFEPTKITGPIPGVKIGDQFFLRVELRIMGLHFQLMNGIDFTETYPTRKLPTSVVTTKGYGDDLMDNNVILYKGDGGNFGDGGKKGKLGKDQIWTNGNVALKNSMMRRKQVRVIRGIKCESKKTVFVYDGLYNVVDCKGICGNRQLARCSGQEPVMWSSYK